MLGKEYDPVRTLEVGTEKEAKEKQIDQSVTQKKRRTPQQVLQQWNNGDRSGLYQCEHCLRVYTTKPDKRHWTSTACIKKE
jgi:hypothetical protein